MFNVRITEWKVSKQQNVEFQIVELHNCILSNLLVASTT
jgi:hypothetical protein